MGGIGAVRSIAWICWVEDGTPCSLSTVGFPVPAHRTRRANHPRTGAPRVPEGLADEFRDLPDERHVVMAGSGWRVVVGTDQPDQACLPSGTAVAHACSGCRDVPYRVATSPIGEPPNTSHTARYRYSITAC